jgi:multicomponent Na+:H+ antiporter subunit D
VFGVETVAALGVDGPLAAAAAVTIIYGSVRALREDDLKRRLAYSTVSQVSYVVLGCAIVGPLSTVGGLAHLVYQGVMKITLFFCAGNLAETLGIHRVSEMNGVGRRMPWSMAAFSVAAFGMIGVPPLAGFFTKWFLGLGALASGQGWVVAVLVVSGALNAAYFLPILHRAWFRAADGEWAPSEAGGRLEAPLALLAPPVITAALVLVVGVLASAEFSPLSVAQYIASLEYGR